MNIVKFYRTIYFYSQKDLVKRSGIPQYRLSRIEAGTAQPTEDEWKAIAEALDMKVSELRGSPCTNTVERYLRSRAAVGHVNGIEEAEILRDLNITERALRKMIQGERIAGALICNEYDERGYYIASTEDEKQRFIHRHMAMIRSLSRECKAFREDLKENGCTPCA